LIAVQRYALSSYRKFRHCRIPVAEEPIGINAAQLHERVMVLDFNTSRGQSDRRSGNFFGLRAEVIFGGEAAARAAERFLILISPFAPAAC
jgi:hypothetical protein